MFAEFYWGHSPIDYLDGTDTETQEKVAYVTDDIDLDPFCMNVSYSCQILLERLLTTRDGYSPALIPWGKPTKDLSTGMCQWCQDRGVGNTSHEHRIRDCPSESSLHHGWDLLMAPAIDNDIVDNGVGTLLFLHNSRSAESCK